MRRQTCGRYIAQAAGFGRNACQVKQGNRAEARKTLGDVIASFIAEGAEFDRQAA